MTEAKEFGCDHRKEFVRNKNEHSRDLYPPSLICEIGEFCGFKFGI
jgi:hypothetical protein